LKSWQTNTDSGQVFFEILADKHRFRTGVFEKTRADKNRFRTGVVEILADTNRFRTGVFESRADKHDSGHVFARISNNTCPDFVVFCPDRKIVVVRPVLVVVPGVNPQPICELPGPARAMVFTKYTVQKGKGITPAVAATGVWADTRCTLPLPLVILELMRKRDWLLRHKMFGNCSTSLRKELEALMGPDELLTGKNTKVFRGRCIALSDVPDYIVKQLARQPKYVQLSLESVGIRVGYRSAANRGVGSRGGGSRGGGSIVKTK